VTTVDRLLAQDAIRRALVDYCHGVDRGDLDLVLSAYHRDAVDRHGTWEGRVRDELPGALRRLVDRTASTVHFLGASTYDWVGDVAHVETSVHAVHEIIDDARERSLEHLFGRYLDVVTCRDGEWRIAERTFVHDVDQLTGTAPYAYPQDVFTRGARVPWTSAAPG
jgi:hypothetical protein